VVLSLLYFVRPKVDPCIFLHRAPRDWVELLGRDFVEVLLERLSHVVNGVDELVDYIFSNPRVAHLLVRGLRIGGRFSRPPCRPGLPRGRVIGSPHRFVATSVICGAVGEAGVPPMSKARGRSPRQQLMTSCTSLVILIKQRRGRPDKRVMSCRAFSDVETKPFAFHS